MISLKIKKKKEKLKTYAIKELSLDIFVLFTKAAVANKQELKNKGSIITLQIPTQTVMKQDILALHCGSSGLLGLKYWRLESLESMHGRLEGQGGGG